VFIATPTQLNSTDLYFALIGCTLHTAWVSCIADRRRQLSCVGEGVYSDATQLDVELSCVAINGPLDAAKRGFYRAANNMFGKIERIASEEVVLVLRLTIDKSKCVPVLVYGLEACAFNKSQMASLDFVVNRFFMKLFNTNNVDTVKACQEFFSFELPRDQLAKRVVKFESLILFCCIILSDIMCNCINIIM